MNIHCDLVAGAAPLHTEVTAQNKKDALDDLPFFFRRFCGLAEKLRIGALEIELPDRRILKFTGDLEEQPVARIVVADFGFAKRTIIGGDIGFFESFADGMWDSPDLAGCLYLFAKNTPYILDGFIGAPLFDALNNVRRFMQKNTRSGSRKNIVAHYDLGNEFYEQWLDPTMTYSSARFTPGINDLGAAQLNKYDKLAQSLDLKPGETVLEIGCGWGGFAEYAARHYKVKITGLTLSPSQLEYARKRIFQADLADKVELRLQDYRDITEKYDKVASIEMFEAVGREYWDTYFRKIHDALKPGGIAGMQIITIRDEFFESYAKSTDFIQRYVFPGGMLPSPSLLCNHVEQNGLTWRRNDEFGQDYAETLRQWNKMFMAAWSDIEPLGFDARFKKLWRFYLAYCEAGFKAGSINVGQVIATRPYAA